MYMLQITPSFSLDEKELVYEFIRASGPGGQNVNKVSTAVQLRFNVCSSPSLPADVRERLVKLSGYRLTKEGILVIEAKRYRTQEQNRLDAEQRLVTLLRKALVRPKKRRSTQPSLSARKERLAAKKRHGSLKKLRQSAPRHDE